MKMLALIPIPEKTLQALATDLEPLRRTTQRLEYCYYQLDAAA